jgi:CBS domain containing-hemolysin-like protein
LITTFGTTAIVFIFSEMLPKTFANDRPDTMAYYSSGILRVIMIVLKPFIAIFSLVTNAVNRIFKSSSAPSITEEDLVEIIEKAGETGVMDEEQSDMMKSALDFQEKTAADVMTPLEKVVSVNINLSRKEMAEILKTSSYSRIPVINGRPDHIIGILHARKYLREYISNKNFDIKSVLSKPYYVKASDSIQDLLDNMSSHRKSLAIVRDEKKKVIGLVTIEDFLEELVGEIWDEEDIPLPESNEEEVIK